MVGKDKGKGKPIRERRNKGGSRRSPNERTKAGREGCPPHRPGNPHPDPRDKRNILFTCTKCGATIS